MSETKYVCDGGKISMSTRCCTAGPCTAIVQDDYVPYRCMLFDDRIPAWKSVGEHKVSEEGLADKETVTDPSRYDQFQGRYVPKFCNEHDMRSDILSEVESFIAGRCSRFSPHCGALSCEDCLMSVADGEAGEKRRRAWLESKGIIKVYNEPEDASDAEEVVAEATAESSETQVETTPETPTITDNSIYDEFKDKFVPHFSNESDLARSLNDADNVEFFLAGECTRFGVQCGGLSCEDCLMSGCASRELREEWLASKGFIQLTQPTDSSNTETAEVSTVDLLCAAASGLKQRIHDAVGYTATIEDIVDFLRVDDPAKDELYALIATKLCG